MGDVRLMKTWKTSVVQWERHGPNKITLGSPSKHEPVLHSLEKYPYYSQSNLRFKPCSRLTCLVASREPAEFVCLGAGGGFVDPLLHPIPVLASACFMLCIQLQTACLRAVC